MYCMMNLRYVWLICLLGWGSSLSAQKGVQAVYDLIERVTPGYAGQYRLEIVGGNEENDWFEIDACDGKVLLRGNHPISLSTAFNHYLKYTCHAHVSWFGNQLNLPKRLPLPKEKTRKVIKAKWRVYMNYCTISYSAAWWDWERWQREIDYMAMNGINMPLSVVGLEGVWYNTLLKFRFSDEEARHFLAGPGHFAWQWMQNIQSFGGPLPKSWIDKHIALGKKIIERQLALGMQPIQQGFSGYVPRELAQKFPEAQIRLQKSWVGFTGSAQLDPTDPLFQSFGKAFLEEEKKLFGAHGVYAADPFHESKPPVDTPEYLNAVGKGIFSLFKAFDPNAVWAMQAWSLREHILKAVPKEDMLVLDLKGSKCRQEDAFWGYPVVAGNLHNFGGRINLHGDLRLLASNQFAAARTLSPNVCGSGLFMEAIEQNPVYYDLAFEMPLHDGAIDVEEWLEGYAERRYGGKSPHTSKAWKILLEGPYRPKTNGTENSSIIAARPALDVKKSGPNAGFLIPYEPMSLVEAEKCLLSESGRFGMSKPYQFDVIDVQRQIMSNLGQQIHKQVVQAFQRKDLQAFRKHSARFLELLGDVDRLLHTRPEFNFDQWLSDARRWGDNKQESDLFAKDAATLVTIWGGDKDPVIFDYSWREWSGLIERYYLQRWKKFYTMLEECLENGRNYSEKGLHLTHGREAFRANDFYNELATWELHFAYTPQQPRLPAVQGNPVSVAQEMFNKYAALAAEYYRNGIQPAQRTEERNIYENLGNP